MNWLPGEESRVQGQAAPHRRGHVAGVHAVPRVGPRPVVGGGVGAPRIAGREAGGGSDGRGHLMNVAVVPAVANRGGRPEKKLKYYARGKGRECTNCKRRMRDSSRDAPIANVT